MPRDLTLTDIEIIPDFHIARVERRGLGSKEITIHWPATFTYDVKTTAETIRRQTSVDLTAAQVTAVQKLLGELKSKVKTQEAI